MAALGPPSVSQDVPVGVTDRIEDRSDQPASVLLAFTAVDRAHFIAHSLTHDFSRGREIRERANQAVLTSCTSLLLYSTCAEWGARSDLQQPPGRLNAILGGPYAAGRFLVAKLKLPMGVSIVAVGKRSEGH
jgi:hypothetical protein